MYYSLSSYQERIYEIKHFTTREVPKEQWRDQCLEFLGMIESGMRRSADEPESPTLPVKLLDVSGSGRGTLLADKIADGGKEF